MDLFNQTDIGAIFSDCKKYRFVLWRIWDKTKPYVMFIGLNPSTANEHIDDSTIKRVMTLANRWGYGGIYMLNLFPFITTDPKKLNIHKNPIKKNDHWIQVSCTKCEKIIFAWGSFKEAKERERVIKNKFKGQALKINLDGSPRHPLYVKNSTKAIIYN